MSTDLNGEHDDFSPDQDGLVIPGISVIPSVGGVGGEDPATAFLLPYDSVYSFTDVLMTLKQRGFGSIPRRDVVRILQSINLRVMGDEFLSPASATDVAFLLECLAMRKAKEVAENSRASRFASIYNMLSSEQPLVKLKAELPEATAVVVEKGSRVSEKRASGGGVSRSGGGDWEPRMLSLEMRFGELESAQTEKNDDDDDDTKTNGDDDKAGHSKEEDTAAVAAREAAAKMLRDLECAMEDIEVKQKAANEAVLVSESAAKTAQENAQAAAASASGAHESAAGAEAARLSANKSAAQCADNLAQMLAALAQAQEAARAALESAQEAAVSAEEAAASAAEDKGLSDEAQGEAVAVWLHGAVGIVEARLLEERVLQLEAMGVEKEKAEKAARLEAEKAAEAERVKLEKALSGLEEALAEQEEKRQAAEVAAQELAQAIEDEKERSMAQQKETALGLEKLEGALVSAKEESAEDRAALRKAEETLGQVSEWQVSEASPLLAELGKRADGAEAWRKELEILRVAEEEQAKADKELLEAKLKEDAEATLVREEEAAAAAAAAVVELESSTKAAAAALEVKMEASKEAAVKPLSQALEVLKVELKALEVQGQELKQEDEERETMAFHDRWAVEVPEPEPEPIPMATQQDLDDLTDVVGGHTEELVGLKDSIGTTSEALQQEVGSRKEAVVKVEEAAASAEEAAQVRFQGAEVRSGALETRVGVVEEKVVGEVEARSRGQEELTSAVGDASSAASVAQGEVEECMVQLKALVETDAQREKERLLREEQAAKDKAEADAAAAAAAAAAAGKDVDDQGSLMSEAPSVVNHTEELDEIRVLLRQLRDDFDSRQGSSPFPLQLEIGSDDDLPTPLPVIEGDVPPKEARRKSSVVVLPEDVVPDSNQATKFALEALEAALSQVVFDCEELSDEVKVIQGKAQRSNNELAQLGAQQRETSAELREAIVQIYSALRSESADNGGDRSPTGSIGSGKSRPRTPQDKESGGKKNTRRRSKSPPRAALSAVLATGRFSISGNDGAGVSFMNSDNGEAEKRRQKEAEEAAAKAAIEAARKAEEAAREMRIWVDGRLAKALAESDVVVRERAEAEALGLEKAFEEQLKEAVEAAATLEDKKAARRERLREKERLRREKLAEEALGLDQPASSKCLSCDRRIPQAKPGSPAWNANRGVLDPFGRPKLDPPSHVSVGPNGLPLFAEHLSPANNKHHASGNAGPDVGTHPHLGPRSAGSPSMYSHSQLQLEQLHIQHMQGTGSGGGGGYSNGYGVIGSDDSEFEGSPLLFDEGNDDDGSVGVDMTAGEPSPFSPGGGGGVGGLFPGGAVNLSKTTRGKPRDSSVMSDQEVEEAGKAMAEEISGEMEDMLSMDGPRSIVNQVSRPASASSDVLAGGSLLPPTSNAPALPGLLGGGSGGSGGGLMPQQQQQQQQQLRNNIVTDELAAGRPVSGGGAGGGLTTNKGRPIAPPQLASIRVPTSSSSSSSSSDAALGAAAPSSSFVPSNQAALNSGVAATTGVRPSTAEGPSLGGFRMKKTGELGSTSQQQQRPRTSSVGDFGGGSRVRGVGAMAAATRGVSKGGAPALRDATSSFGVLPNRAPSTTRFYGLQRSFPN